MTTQISYTDVDQMLKGTPYTIPEDAENLARFRQVYQRSTAIHEQASHTMKRIERDAEKVFETFKNFLRSDLVAESNKIEGYQWSTEQVQLVVQTHKELVNTPVHNLMTAISGDIRVIEALGLYKAHLLADDWVNSSTQRRPLPAEIRAFHAQITPQHDFAGAYKTSTNEIGGSNLKTTEPWDVPMAMRQLTSWWESAKDDPVLTATIIHAWLTHIHPFDDGNGRLARLLANLELAASGFPPMIIREQADRGQYYDALAHSDEGDILPLYDLFSRVLKRTVDTMSTPSYVEDIVNRKFLKTSKARYDTWLTLLNDFTKTLQDRLARNGWSSALQGRLDLDAFSLLCAQNGSGSSWYMKIFNRQGFPTWLLWFGFNSDEIKHSESSVNTLTHRYPSILFSTRNLDRSSVHPFRPTFNSGDSRIPSEIILLPGSRLVTLLRWNNNSRSCMVQDAAILVADAICNENG